MMAAALAAAVALAGALVACGDDGPVDASPTAAPATEPVAFASPTIVASTLTSTEKGYSVTFPESWNIRPNYVYVGAESLDAAFLDSDVPSGSIRPTLTIGCFPTGPGGPPTQGEFADARLTALRSTLAEPPQTSTRVVAGIQATVATYVKEIAVDETQIDRIRQQDLFLVAPLCAFTISLLSTPEDEAAFQPQFDALVNSFLLLP